MSISRECPELIPTPQQDEEWQEEVDEKIDEYQLGNILFV